MPADRETGRNPAYFEPLRDLKTTHTLALGVIDYEGSAERTAELVQAAAEAAAASSPSRPSAAWRGSTSAAGTARRWNSCSSCTRSSPRRCAEMDALARVPVSTLCDVDKSLPVVDPAIRPLTAARLCGPAYTVVAAGEFLSVLYAIGEAGARRRPRRAGRRPPLAALGELLATEAWRRQLGGIVVDGYVRDRSGLPELPLWARGTVPIAGPVGRRAARRRAGGVRRRAGLPRRRRRRRRRRARDRAARATRGVPSSARRRSSRSRPPCSRESSAASRGRDDEPVPSTWRGCGGRGRARWRSRRRAEHDHRAAGLAQAPWPLPTFAAAEVRNPARAARRSAARTIPWVERQQRACGRSSFALMSRFQRIHGDGREQRVTTLELFYDLVFVFAITQVSHLLLEHLTWEGAGAVRADPARRVVVLELHDLGHERARPGLARRPAAADRPDADELPDGGGDPGGVRRSRAAVRGGLRRDPGRAARVPDVRGGREGTLERARRAGS